MSLTPTVTNLKNRRAAGVKVKTSESITGGRKTNRGLLQYRSARTMPNYVHAGHLKYENPDGTVRLVERAHPWRWGKDAARQAAWAKKKHEEFKDSLRKEVGTPPSDSAANPKE
jgi:hypothetical protein